MTQPNLYPPFPGLQSGFTARDYQIQDHDESFRLWDSGTIGVLTRAFTGSGKTIQGCLKADTWLSRGDNRRVMIVSYEIQLIHQFAQEVEDVLGICPGIEMADAKIDPDCIPKISVVSRQSLLQHKQPTTKQVEELGSYGIFDIRCATQQHCKKALESLKNGQDREVIVDMFERINEDPHAKNGTWSRLHKFDWHFDWLVIFDEAHRHVYGLVSVGHLVDWFDQNPNSRRLGLTATPKRGDGVSIGSKMFPGIALDMPLYSTTKRCGVKEGYGVPYVQKYIEVEGVDFKSIARIAGDFDEGELEKILGEESQLARLVDPMLDLVGSRQTLIFSPGVEMAKNVARFINARVETKCPMCGKVKWFPRLLLAEDGFKCECGCVLGREFTPITKSGEQARELDANSHPSKREEAYRDHQNGLYQFLSIVGLCREGYNDPNVAAVAVFRPVSKAASSLAEQMKGRACRPLRGLINGLETKEERLAAIAASEKPHAVIIDLVGITGLADCASTVRIYADGLPDEIIERAEQITLEAEDGIDVEEAVEQAKKEDEDRREAIRLEREANEKIAKERAEARAKAGAEVKYSTNEVGFGSAQDYDPLAASEGQYKYMRALGMDVLAIMSKKQAGRMIDQLLHRVDPEEVARTNRIKEDSWKRNPPSDKQLGFMRWKGVPTDKAKTPRDAGLLLDAKLEPEKFVRERLEGLRNAKDGLDLDAIGKDIGLVRGVLPDSFFRDLVRDGAIRRQDMARQVDDF